MQGRRFSRSPRVLCFCKVPLRVRFCMAGYSTQLVSCDARIPSGLRCGLQPHGYGSGGAAPGLQVMFACTICW